MEEKISACQTLTDIAELERTHSLNEEEQRLVFERRLKIISDSWTPEQRQRFLNEWLDESYITEAIRGEKRTHNEMMNEKPSTSKGRKRGYGECESVYIFRAKYCCEDVSLLA